jgi:hypothetical protein
MPVMLERWNDDRMDALDTKVDDMGVRLARVEVRVDDGFKKVDMRFETVETELLEQRREMKAGFQRMDDRFERMQWYLLGAAVTIIVALIGAPHL